MLCISYYCLFLFFSGPGEKHITGSAWKWGEKKGKGGSREQGGEMTQTMYAHVNKWIIKKNREMSFSTEVNEDSKVPYPKYKKNSHIEQNMFSRKQGYNSRLWKHLIFKTLKMIVKEAIQFWECTLYKLSLYITISQLIARCFIIIFVFKTHIFCYLA
jgi:hypothetical protein